MEAQPVDGVRPVNGPSPARVAVFSESGCLGMQPKGVKPLRGKRVGSAQSARGIQPGGEAVPVARVCSASKPPAFPLRGVASGAAGAAARRGSRPPSGALPPRRCAATGSGSAGRVRGRRWLVSSGLELYSALPAPTSPLATRGRGRVPPRLPPPAGAEDGAPPLPTRLSTGPDCPQSVA
ncbi:hypothetical protein P4O66_019980 [Electrophorus voltai]|uniref:Uncharacterized protein n=1 Tax=Electrophorus voltai TaxID=2609070 RepID=A0AAD9DJZ8_9TELE|nr:hypothetical protein P4O66_019980 [Electrophorus voltai]